MEKKDEQKKQHVSLEQEYRGKLAILIGVEYQKTGKSLSKEKIIQNLINQAIEQAIKDGLN